MLLFHINKGSTMSCNLSQRSTKYDKACKFILLGICVSLSIMSCKEDRLGPDASPAERAYWEDYESPEHKWGYISRAGKIAIDPIYDDLGDMRTPLIPANLDGRWGCIDFNGQLKIEHRYKQIMSLTGSKVIALTFENDWLLTDGTASGTDTLAVDRVVKVMQDKILTEKDGLMQVLDASGKPVLKQDYEKIKLATDGYYIVKDKGLYGLLDENGTTVIGAKYTKLKPSEKKTYIARESDKDYLIDLAEGKEYGPYDRIRGHQGYSLLTYTGQQYQLVDLNTKAPRVITVEALEPVGAGLWKYRTGRRWGLMDAEGRKLIDAQYDLINRYSDGLVGVSKDDIWGYLDTSGQLQIPLQYVLIWDFHDGLARVIGERGVGFIDSSGHMVINDIFLEVRDFHNDRARFQTY